MNRQLLGRRGLGLAAGLAATMLVAGCSGFSNAPVVPPRGFLFQDIKAPLTTEYNATPVGTANSKQGSSSTKYFLDFLLTWLGFAWDDASVEAIARRHGIENISYAEYEHLSVLGVYQEFTVTVYGN